MERRSLNAFRRSRTLFTSRRPTRRHGRTVPWPAQKDGRIFSRTAEDAAGEARGAMLNSAWPTIH